MPHDQLEEGRQVLARPVQFGVCPAGPATGIDMREIQLVVGGAQVGEQVEHLVQRAVGFGIGLVDLVQHHDGAQGKG